MWRGGHYYAEETSLTTFPLSELHVKPLPAATWRAIKKLIRKEAAAVNVPGCNKSSPGLNSLMPASFPGHREIRDPFKPSWRSLRGLGNGERNERKVVVPLMTKRT